jgi:hypothetical protein
MKMDNRVKMMMNEKVCTIDFFMSKHEYQSGWQKTLKMEKKE